jgi:hypothetical protein
MSPQSCTTLTHPAPITIQFDRHNYLFIAKFIQADRRLTVESSANSRINTAFTKFDPMTKEFGSNHYFFIGLRVDPLDLDTSY